MSAGFWPWIDAAGYAAAKGMLSILWQSSILLLCVALTAHILRRRPAATRHAVWVAGLLAVALVPAANWVGPKLGALQHPVGVMPAYDSAPASPARPISGPSSRTMAARPTQGDVLEAASPLREVETVPGEGLLPLDRAETDGRTPGASRFHPWAWGAALYVLGVLLMLSRLALGWWRLKRRAETGRRVDPTAVIPLLPRRAAQVLASRRVRVIECESLSAPMTAGLARPVILIPDGFLARESAGDLRAVFTHELAHVERCDACVLWIASIFRSLLFFHPLVWIATRRIATLAEYAADDRVLEEASSPAEYAKVLARMAERLPGGPAHTEFPTGAMLSRNALVSRVKAVLDWRQPVRGLSRTGLLATVGAIVLAAGLAFALPVGEKGAAVDAGPVAPAAAPKDAAPAPAAPAPATPAVALPSPADAIVFDPNLMWFQCAWADKITYYAWDEDRVGGHYFWIGEPGKRYVWNYYFGAPVSAAQYQRLTLTYRARNVPPLADSVLWLDDGRGPERGKGVFAVRSRDITPDGEIHEITCDLADLKPAGDYVGMAIGVTCAEKAPAEFELLGLRLDRKPDVKAAPVTDDAPLRVSVVDADGKPVPDAVVAVEGERLNAARRARTDAAGLATVLPIRSLGGGHTISATRPGWTRVEWRGVSAEDAQPLLLRIDPTVACSGRVVDAAGEPVPGVVVDLHSRRFFEGQRTGAHQQGGISLLTDAKGVWRCRSVDATATDLRLRLTHPQYPLDSSASSRAGAPTFDQMRDGTAVSRVTRGFPVTGVVRNLAGAPVKGVMVTWSRYQIQSGTSPAYSDALGRFEFTVAKPSFLRVTFTGPDCGPARVDVPASPGMAPISVVVGPPHAYHFRVVDTQGRPVPGAIVSVLSWRGQDAIPWRGTADQEGRVSWLCGPPDGVVFDVGSRSGMVRRTEELSAREEPHVITLGPPLRISGRVTDAETGQPVDRFTVSEGFTWDERDSIYWQQSDRGPVRGGSYSREFRFPYKNQYIRIEADGYAPAISRPYKADEGTQTFDVALKRPLFVGGVVRDKDGRPVADAKVTVLPKVRYLRLVDGRIDKDSMHRGSSFTTAQTDAEGRYYIPEQDAGLRLFVNAAEGFALVSREEAAKSRDVTLQPWARVEGSFMIGSRPAAGRKIVARVEDRALASAEPVDAVEQSWNAVADEKGEFVFERLVPGGLSISDLVKVADLPGGGEAWGSTQHHMLTVPPGGAARIKLGGMGRPVVGRLAYSQEVVSVGIGRVDGFITPRQRPKLFGPPPADFAQWTAERQDEWRAKRAEEFKARGRELPDRSPQWRVFIQPDGSFRADDVVAGDYNLIVTVYASSSPDGDSWRSLGQAVVEFSIPEIPGGRSDEALDLGKVVPKAIERAQTPEPGAADRVK